MVMASFDIKSLFTNIPLNETIDIFVELLFDSSMPLPTNIDRAGMKSLLNIAAKESYFLFNQRVYHQIDGVAMGSPLGPTFTNIFLSFHEKKWLENCPTDFKPLL